MSFAKTRHFIFLLFISAIALNLLLYAIFGKELKVDDLREFTSSFGIWLPIVFVALYAGISVFLPTTPLMAASGILFGFKHALIYSLLGGFLSAFITFYIARYLGKDFVDKILHKKFLSRLEEYDEKIAKRGFLSVMILRVTPIMPFNVLNLLMGISKVRAKDYALGTLVGLVPSHMLTIYFGGLILVFVSNRIISALMGLALLLIFIIVFYKNRKVI